MNLIFSSSFNSSYGIDFIFTLLFRTYVDGLGINFDPQYIWEFKDKQTATLLSSSWFHFLSFHGDICRPALFTVFEFMDM